jgi:hypothetical protein
VIGSWATDCERRAGSWRQCCRLAGVAAWLLLAHPANAQNTLSVSPTGVGPGSNVVVAIAAETTTKLTGLVADLEFDPALCARIANSRIEPSGRTVLGPEQVVVDPEEISGCPQAGRVSMVLIDLAPRDENGEATIPAGAGEIARWVFSLTGAGSAASHPLTIRVREARNGPEVVALQTTAGALTCAGNCNADGMVAINELIVGVNVASGAAAASACSPMDTNGNGEVVINELIAAVNSALNGCRI